VKDLKEYILEKSWDKYQQNTYPDNSIKSAIYDYVSGMTSGINHDLRRNITRGSKQVVSNLDAAFNDSKFADNKIIDVYRTVDWNYMKNIYNCTKENIDDFIGKTFINKGYMSTSKNFISPWSNVWDDSELIIHITSNKKCACIDINKIFKSTEIDCYDQNEILLPRNTKLKLISYKIQNINYNRLSNNYNNYILEMKIIE
jgi:hypothetical protein